MNVVAESERLARLRALPLSPALRAMAEGRLPHPQLWRCQTGTPFYVYRGAEVPAGPVLIPLWDWNDWVLGVRERPDGLEFVRFDIEMPDEVECLARTEAGLWARLFDALYEDDLELEELEAIAQAVDYRYWPLQLQRRQTAEPQFGTDLTHPQWLEETIAAVDAVQSVQPGA
ncbi:hypothetical protein [Lysobacter enzymogenes]|uniref:hypothetical protein n=1 Tax=Lysobacter enzymogenes TaxID=69 RepID=UPI00089BF184|nr:hypothetical protein [Lysobacter enzymogenes]SDX20475.1 hypothetical protein SAMN05421681_104210 [Lysobacter enzymogenes]